jgi:hypothetical protein
MTDYDTSEFSVNTVDVTSSWLLATTCVLSMVALVVPIIGG